MTEVVSNATEAETGGLYNNEKEARPIRTALTQLGFPQGRTPTANDIVKLRRSETMDMR